MLPLTNPTVIRAVPVKIMEIRNFLSSIQGIKKAKIKESNGINPIKINEINVAIPVFIGFFEYKTTLTRDLLYWFF